MNAKLKKDFTDLDFIFWKLKKTSISEDSLIYFGNASILIILEYKDFINLSQYKRFIASLNAYLDISKDPISEVELNHMPEFPLNLFIFSKSSSEILDSYKDAFEKCDTFNSIEEVWSSKDSKLKFLSLMNPGNE
tara:strand:- start:11833 stop:12237 length:405 start_codon:yes stop_codon:yes gene_type:complete